jgi:beta-N-acetylhexosaminidase
MPFTDADTDLRRLALSVLLPGFTGTSLPRWLGDRLAEGLGGACLFGQNVEGPEQVAELTAAVHRARPGALVASDEEGGSVTRLHVRTGSPWPGHATLGALDDERATYAIAHGLGHDAAGAGIDLVLSPVLDVNSERENPVIGIRSFGADPELVARHGAAFVHGLQDAGVLACAKHYPGHGATRTDSHLALPVLDVDPDTWRRRDLAPFTAAVKAGAAAVMTAHVVVSALDERPATLSPVHLRLLRGELGFPGLVVSDALDMQAISAGVGRPQGAVLALAAGVDLLCVGNPLNGYDEEAAVEEIVAAVQDAVERGELPLERLQDASRRVATARDRTQAWTGREPASRHEPPGEDAGQDAGQDAVAAARRAIRVRGDVRLRGPALLLVTRSAESIAAGSVDSALVSVMGERRPDWPVREVRDADQARAAVAAASEVLVVVEGRPDPVHPAVVAAVLEEVPDAVVVYGGLPTADDRVGNLLEHRGDHGGVHGIRAALDDHQHLARCSGHRGGPRRADRAQLRNGPGDGPRHRGPPAG